MYDLGRIWEGIKDCYAPLAIQQLAVAIRSDDRSSVSTGEILVALVLQLQWLIEFLVGGCASKMTFLAGFGKLFS